ncbi:hypothetical protein [Kitasatospora sp. NPDC101183]|uniref:hypothetical protein n=1 Tax=Kitasatospora sp. NPDC101183 TaxID=3364100 RepID=UPI0038096041
MIATPEQLAAVLRPVKHILLDFDGPACSVFAGCPASEVARRLREGLLATGGQDPAGAAAGAPTIGYANKLGKGAKLAAAGAVVIVDSMKLMADALA